MPPAGMAGAAPVVGGVPGVVVVGVVTGAAGGTAGAVPVDAGGVVAVVGGAVTVPVVGVTAVAGATPLPGGSAAAPATGTVGPVSGVAVSPAQAATPIPRLSRIHRPAKPFFLFLFPAIARHSRGIAALRCRPESESTDPVHAPLILKTSDGRYLLQRVIGRMRPDFSPCSIRSRYLSRFVRTVVDAKGSCNEQSRQSAFRQM
jgi:hypothetical protein